MPKKNGKLQQIEDGHIPTNHTCECLYCGHRAEYEPMRRLNQDLKKASSTLTRDEVTWYVKRYYQIQGLRIATNNMFEAALSTAGAPNQLLKYELQLDSAHERQIVGSMERYAESRREGRWLLSLLGVGPILAAGFMAYLDIEKAPTSGHFISYAGLDPRQVWPKREQTDAWVRDDVKEYGAVDVETVIRACAYWHRNPATVLRDATRKRRSGIGMQTVYDERPLNAENLASSLARIPWNAALKNLCWKWGDVMVKFHNQKPEENIYGQMYMKHKVRAIERNASGGFKELAEKTLEKRTFRDKATKAIYERGEIPAGRVDYWARRKVLAVFLNHVHHVMFECKYDKAPPLPYTFAMGIQEHAHYIPPPKWPAE